MTKNAAEAKTETIEPNSNSQDGSGSDSSSFGKSTLRIIAGGLLLAVLPLLAASETSIKDLISGWFQDCKLIIEMGPAKFSNGRLEADVPVTVYAAGNATLSEVRLAFSTPTKIIEKVVLSAR